MSVRPYILDEDDTCVYDYTYTFQYDYTDASLHGIAKNNVISKQLLNIEDTVTINTIPGNVFYDKCYNNYIEYNCTDNIIYESTHILLNNNCSSNTIKSGCSDITLSQECRSNTINSKCENITLSQGCENNIINSRCSNITLSQGCEGNAINSGCENITLSQGCKSNTINSKCKNITLSNAESYMNIDSNKEHEIFNNSKYYSYNASKENYFILTHESVDDYTLNTGITKTENSVSKTLDVNTSGNIYTIYDVDYSKETNQVKKDINLTANGINGSITTGYIKCIRATNTNLGFEEGSDSHDGKGFLSEGYLEVGLYIKLNNKVIGESSDKIKLSYGQVIVRDTNTDKQIIENYSSHTFNIISKSNNIDFKRGDTINIEYQMTFNDDYCHGNTIVDPKNPSKKLPYISGEIIAKDLSVTSKDLTLEYTQNIITTPITSKLIIIANDGILVRGLNGKYCLIKQTNDGINLNINGDVNVQGTLKLNGNSVSVINNTTLPNT